MFSFISRFQPTVKLLTEPVLRIFRVFVVQVRRPLRMSQDLRLRLFSYGLLGLMLVPVVLSPLQGASVEGAEEIGVQEFIMHHVVDSKVWHPLPLLDFSVYFPQQELITLGGQTIEFKNGLHALMLLIAFMVLNVLFVGLYRRNPAQAPSGLTNLLETLVLFIRDGLAIEYLGERDGKKFTPFFLTIFFMILSLNLMGLIPAFSTATANVNITAAFAMMTLGCMVVGGVKRNGLIGFFNLFIPSGVPIVLRPFLFILEFVGLFIKPFALTIRLFANLLAGHIVIFSILGVIITFGIAGLPVLGLGLFIYLLEIFVAFLQAYIFTLLSAIFIGEMLHPAH